MSLHRLVDIDTTIYLYRFRLFNGLELHFTAPDMWTAMETFKKHPQYESTIQTCSQVAKVDG